MTTLILTLIFFCLFFASNAYEEIHDADIPELSYLDTSIDPCNDFYQFTCGNFYKSHQIQDGDSHVDHFSLLEDDILHLARDILSSEVAPDDPQAVKKAKTAYKACFNTDLYDKQNSVLPEMKFINDWGGMPLVSQYNSTSFSWNDIGKMSAHFGIPLLFTLMPYPQLDCTEGYLVVIEQDSLTNPSLIRPSFGKFYDQVLDESLSDLGRTGRKLLSSTPLPFDVFLMTVATLLAESSQSNKTVDELQDDLDNMANFMRQLARGGIIEDDVKIQPFSSRYPTLEELQNWTESHFGNTTNLNWIEYFNNIFSLAGVNATNGMKTYPYSAKFVYGVLNLVRQTDPKVVKNFAMFRVLLYLAPDSTGPMREAFETYYNAKNYPLYPRWEYCTRKLLDITDTASLSFAVTYAYQRYHFNRNRLSEAASLVKNIMASFEQTLQESEWMDEVSKTAALVKLQKMLLLLGYPDFIDDQEKLDRFYRNVRICAWDNYGNAQRIRAFKQAYLFSQLAKPKTRAFWDKSPLMVNAYYNRPNNRIVLPIAMLNKPYFGDSSMLDFSRLGSIIGHEITHGFDYDGQTYNQDGLQKPWWTVETTALFHNRTQCFIEQYNRYYIEEIDTYVNGTLTLNENLADNGGIRQAYKAYQKQVEQYHVVLQSNYTLEQLFFIGYGTSWCSNQTVSYMMNYKTSNYSPNKYRVNGPLANMEEFADAFNCPKGTTMNPTKRCTLW